MLSSTGKYTYSTSLCVHCVNLLPFGSRGSGFMGLGLGLLVPGSGFRVPGFGFMDSDSAFRVSGFGFGVSG